MLKFPCVLSFSLQQRLYTTYNNLLSKRMSASSSSNHDHYQPLSTWIITLNPQTSHSNLISSILRAVNTIQTICSNILKNPTEEKYRRIRLLLPSSSSSSSSSRPEPIQNIINVTRATTTNSPSSTTRELTFLNWLSGIGFEFEGAHVTSTTFAHFGTNTPLQILDKVCVEAIEIAEECRRILQQREDEQVARALEEKKRENENLQQSKLSSLEQYRQFADERKKIQKWVTERCQSILNKKNNGNGDDESLVLTELDKDIHDAINFIQEDIMMMRYNRSTTSTTLKNRRKFVQDFFSDDWFGQQNADDTDAARKICDEEGMILFQKALEKSSLSQGQSQQQQCFQAVIDALESFRHDKNSEFDQLRHQVTQNIQSRDQKQQLSHKKQEDAKARPVFIHPELEHTAISLINDISGFMELCWRLEGETGYRANFRIEAKNLTEKFYQGEVKVEELRKLKEQWELKYEKMKLAKGTPFFGGQNPIDGSK